MKPAVASLLALWVPVLTGLAVAAAPGSFAFKAQVLHDRLGPMKRFTLTVDGQPAITDDGGVFQVPLASGTTHVVVAVTGPSYAIHYPYGGFVAVPRDHADSNFRMAMEALLSRVPIPPARIHRMEAERQDLDAAAAAYGDLLPAALDVLVLGMGADGHTASLFPGSPALAERERRVVVVDGPKPPRRRMTITPPVIAAARHVVVLVTGKEKAAAVARAVDEATPASEIPAALARHGVWFLDRAAAARLARPVP